MIRIGILADSPLASRYVHDLVVWANTRHELSISHLILHPADPAAKPASTPSGTSSRARRFYGAISRKFFNLVVALERRRLCRDGHHAHHFDRINLAALVPEKLAIQPVLSSSGLSCSFSEADIRRVEALGLDALIRSGGRILRGGILKAARFGVISFHHADNQINRGTPAGFWEVFSQQDTTGFTLQRLTEELDGGDVLMRGHFPTRHYYLLNQASLYQKSNHYLKLLLLRLADTDSLPPVISAVPYSYPLFRPPLAHQTAAYIGRSLASSLKKKWFRLLRMEERWQVSVVRGSWRNAVLWRAKPVRNPPGRYFADPFLFDAKGKTFCAVEDYDIASAKGRISVLEIDAQGNAIPLGVVIDEPFHLSFPFVFEYGGGLYMCPESHANRDIRIYRCVESPLHWVLEKIVMGDVRAADTMLFEARDKWWMLTNIDPSGSGDLCSELFVFSADSPLSQTWLPHSVNPVVVDAGRARNGGLLRDGKTFFRVSQRQGFDRYGVSSQINEITSLSDDVYEERCVAILEPRFRPGLLGMHHLHSVNDLTVFDTLSRRHDSA